MIQIFVDSGANLSPELREQYNIHLLPMALTIDDQPAPEGLDGHEYYEALRSGADVRTSMVNPDDARKAFEPFIAQGDDVVYFSISAGISGSWWSAKLAGDELMEQYPQRRVCPIDSMGASLGAGIQLGAQAGQEIHAAMREKQLEHAHTPKNRWTFSSVYWPMSSLRNRKVWTRSFRCKVR